MSHGPLDFNALDTVVHGPVRLAALTALQIDGPLDFTTLKKRLGVTDGALGLHLQKLEAIAYVRADTVLHGRRPRTTYRLTPAGRRALAGYLDFMRRLLDAVEVKGRGNNSS